MTPMHDATSFPSPQDIVDHLDVEAVYRGMGLDITGQSDKALYCRAMGREDRTPSAQVNKQTGWYKDHGGGDPDGLNLFQFAAKFGGFATERDAREHFAVEAGLLNGGRRAAPAPTKPTSAPKKDKPTPAYRTAAEAIAAAEKTLGPMSKRFDYHDTENILFLVVARWDRDDGKKTFRQLSLHPEGWMLKGCPGKNPLYNAPAISNSSGPVYLAEGEKAADALSSIGVLATTSPQGAKSAGQADWSLLAGREVRVCPDNDAEGEAYARDAAKALSELSPPARVKLVEIPWLPSKGDAADWIDQHDAAEPHELREQLETWASSAKEWRGDQWREVIRPVTFTQLAHQNPSLMEVIIHDLLRRKEVANIISGAKVGKSWLVYLLALTLVTGNRWLGRFDCRQSRVLIIDNELHASTLVNRINMVADALGFDPCEWSDRLDVLSLRGRLASLYDIDRMADDWGDKYDLIICDAFYRAIPAGVSENDNAEITQLYNLQDAIVAKTNASWINIHHASKGSQGGKAVTDIGSGAGAQSRAADTHIVLREHEDEGCAVLEAAVRSFAPVPPLTLRWQFPLWTADGTIDPKAVKGRLSAGEQRQREKDQEGMEVIAEALSEEPATNSALQSKTGFSRDRIKRLLGMLESAGRVTSQAIEVNSKAATEYRIRAGISPDSGGMGEWAIDAFSHSPTD